MPALARVQKKSGPTGGPQRGMAPDLPGHSAERQYHVAGGGAVVPNGKAAAPVKGPGTPRRETTHSRERAMQDPGLKDYVCAYTLCVLPHPHSPLQLIYHRYFGLLPVLPRRPCDFHVYFA